MRIINYSNRFYQEQYKNLHVYIFYFIAQELGQPWRSCDRDRVLKCVNCRPTCKNPQACDLSVKQGCTDQCVCISPNLEDENGDCVLPNSATCVEQILRSGLTRDDGDGNMDEEVEIGPADPVSEKKDIKLLILHQLV